MKEKTLFSLLLLTILSVLGGLFYCILFLPTSEPIYIMPNGIICKNSFTVGYESWSAATHEFNSCSDGRTYVNPEYYNVKYVKKKPLLSLL